MKKTAKNIIYSIAELLCYAVAPLIFIVIQYGDTTEGVVYKIGFIGILLCILVVWIVKKTILKKWVDKLRGKITQHEGDLETESDPVKIENLKEALKSARTIETLFSALIPFLLLCALLVMCHALEAAIVKLSGAIGFTLISFFIGTVFSILNAREVHGKYEEKK